LLLLRRRRRTGGHLRASLCLGGREHFLEGGMPRAASMLREGRTVRRPAATTLTPSLRRRLVSSGRLEVGAGLLKACLALAADPLKR
jgi:hypothetical protein